MLPVQNGLICWLDAMDGKAGDTLLKDRTSYGHNLIVENFQQGYGFTGTSIKVKQSKTNTSNNNALYIANGGFKTSCKSFCICIERHNTNQPWYIFDGRGLDGQGSNTNHCFNGNTGLSYDNSKTRRDSVLTYDNSNLDINKKTFLYFELKEAELFTLSILMRYSKNENTEGEFYSLYAYNRALTEEEILQNMEYENNKISYVNETNLPKIVDKLSNASNIKIANNKYGNRVQTVIDKIVEKADDVTKAVEQEVVNDSHSFKIGTGNVDVSADVQDGFGEVGVKGVTYQNLIPNLIDSRWQVRGSAIKDRTDLVNGVKLVITSEGSCVLDLNDISMFKPNTKYTLLVNIDTNFTDIRLSNILSSSVKLKNGFNCVTFLTKSDFNEMYTCFRIGYTGNLPTGIYMTIKDLIVLEGDHTNNPNLPSYFEGIVGVGDKSKNLLNINTENHAHGVDFKFEKNVLKSSGIGSVSILQSFKITGLTIGKTYTISCNSDDVGVNSNGTILSLTPTTYRSFVFNDTESIYFQIRQNVDCTKEIKFLLEEGTKATPYEPYYDGHKIEILSCGKNLYKPNLQTKSSNGLTFSLHGNTLIVNGTCTKYVDFRPINKNESITLELYNYVSKLPIGTTLNLSNNLGLKNYFSLKRNGAQTYLTNTLIIQEGDYDIGCFVRFEEGQSYNNQQLNIQLEINSKATEFEPYIEDKTQILLDEPLMRLDTSKDEITRDGKLIKRLCLTEVDGTEEWSRFYPHTIEEESIVFVTRLNKDSYINCVQDYRLKSTFAPTNETNTILSKEAVQIYDSNLRVKLLKSRLTSLDVVGFKKWLSSNPIQILYLLKEPIIIDIVPPTLRIFKDGHLTFNTLVAPESNHVVQLNKSAQIQNAIKESQSLDNRINVLENNYDNLILSTMSRLSDLELNYTLK